MQTVSVRTFQTLLGLLIGLVLGLILWQMLPGPALAADLQVEGVHLEPCPLSDPGSQSACGAPPVPVVTPCAGR